MRAQVTRLHPNTYAIVSRAVEEGARCGVRRAFKHTDTPGEEAIADAVARAVMDSISEVIDFGDGK